MRLHLKQYTEPIFEVLAGYRATLVAHPLLTAARAGELSRETLHEFAFHQYSDSILWIPMLAQMKAMARKSARLRKAIEDNIAHEAGLGNVSHVQLAVALMRSLGITSLEPFPTRTFERSATLWLSDAFCDQSEPEVAGWLLVAESLVPLMFAALQPSFVALGADTRYFGEHVEVDTDEHAAWMAESVEDVLDIYGPAASEAITAGMVDAWQETREVPDALWRKQCASH
ncbi:MAG TPA: iron-containing redox enzyme family protein [Kofleriaceae bacterium]|nr:iron-containing redox enzyme family protein [Kofleriaceae bacterium]